jgi:hypothetical protein
MSEDEPTSGRAAEERARLARLREKKRPNPIEREQARQAAARKRHDELPLPRHLKRAMQETGGAIVQAVEARQEEDRAT